MRVIAGTARRLLLMTPAGTDTRPTTDRIKETLFNMLNPQLAGREFLDLFAGSGAIGIEALSRGAKHACFAEFGRDALRCIRENLEHTHLADRATVYGMDAFAALDRMRMEKRRFDIVFLDPPYGRGLEVSALASLRRGNLLAEDATVVVETAIGYDASALEKAGYRVTRVKEYKTNQHLFLTPLDA
ncbi:MAG: 16S rRNA (guanine(966)-N(2))-methyltransferase RsmD [Lachnospiraceae bacterium]|nr:16S rRNA (guanine(966)-N(2))-methyltransferase RsmD [Lachnospiraceae bacterium]